VGILILSGGNQLVCNLFIFICMELVLVYEACKRTVYLPCILAPLLRSSSQINSSSLLLVPTTADQFIMSLHEEDKPVEAAWCDPEDLGRVDVSSVSFID
jgi:hypothetical protein